MVERPPCTTGQTRISQAGSGGVFSRMKRARSGSTASVTGSTRRKRRGPSGGEFYRILSVVRMPSPSNVNSPDRRVMIGETVTLGNDAQRRQMIEETLRFADAGHGMQALAGQVGRPQVRRGIVHAMKNERPGDEVKRWTFGNGTVGASAAIGDHCIHPTEARSGSRSGPAGSGQPFWCPRRVHHGDPTSRRRR